MPKSQCFQWCCLTDHISVSVSRPYSAVAILIFYRRFRHRHFFASAYAALPSALCSLPWYDTHTHTHTFNGPLAGTTGWAGTRKVKPIWILLEQETVSGHGISWAICKSAPRSKQITMPEPHHSVLQAGCPSCRPTNSVKHWWQKDT